MFRWFVISLSFSLSFLFLPFFLYKLPSFSFLYSFLPFFVASFLSFLLHLFLFQFLLFFPSENFPLLFLFLPSVSIIILPSSWRQKGQGRREGGKRNIPYTNNLVFLKHFEEKLTKKYY